MTKAGELARNAPYFRRQHLDDFFQRLHKCTSSDRDPIGDEVTIIAATAICQCSTCELLNLIFKHRILLHVEKRKKIDFRSFLISASQAKLAIGLSAEGAINLTEAAKRLGVDTRTIRNLVAEGYLTEATKTEKSAERWQVVNETSVVKFVEQYISAFDLAREHGRDTGNLCRELYKQGVEPLILNGRNRVIFRRRDLV